MGTGVGMYVCGARWEVPALNWNWWSIACSSFRVTVVESRWWSVPLQEAVLRRKGSRRNGDTERPELRELKRLGRKEQLWDQ